MKQIKNYENYYICEDGKVFSKNIDSFMECRLIGIGYLGINLCKNNKYETKYIHRLVAETFIPNPKNKLTVNHINGIKIDNRIENNTIRYFILLFWKT